MSVEKRPDEFMWEEKYRPTTISEILLPKRYKDLFSNMVEGGELLNMVFSGQPGTGKTTSAKALCEELGLEYKVINASDKNGIDVVRNLVMNYGSTCSYNGKYKVLILDEGERMTSLAQDALKNPIEELRKNLRFIFTTNDHSLIIPALKSRLKHTKFDFTESDKKEIAKSLIIRIFTILQQEGVKFNPNDKKLQGFVINSMPDIRSILGRLQSLAIETNNDFTGADLDLTVEKLDIETIKMKVKGDYFELKKFVEKVSSSMLIRVIEDNVLNITNNDPGKIRQVMNFCNNHDFKHGQVMLPSLNMTTFLLNIQATLDW